jgi:D-alanyl-D-alanine carboxypeptidase/D-alanyl-D-alanine-endopeptidase (penicillin-binding protein 4)
MRILLVVFCAFISLNVLSQPLTQRIQKAYDQFSKDPQLQNGLSSLTVINTQTGEVIFSANGNLGLPPASTLKTVTSVTAFNLLGQDFTWKTSLAYSGVINADGTLDGNIILIGGGDPTLGSSRYAQSEPKQLLGRWLKAISQSGIKRINGGVISDDRLFGTQSLPVGWIWEDMGNYYGAGTSGLTWGENQFGLLFKAGSRPGDLTKLARTEPDIDYLKIVNEVITGPSGSGDNVYAYSAPYSDIIYLRGSYGIDLQKTIFASLTDPAYEVAYRLEDNLKKSGIAVSASPATARRLALNNQTVPVNPKVIDTYTSPDLGKVVYWFNQKSLNIYGEQILKTLTLKQGKDVNTSGADAIISFWVKKLAIDSNSIKMLDGSGLSPETRVTTLTMAKILQSAKKEPWFNSFYESLPLYNNMKMKSGSIREVLAYAGYQTSASGVPLAFSFITSNYNGGTTAIRQKMFNMLDALK